jgi:hypothetical protein
METASYLVAEGITHVYHDWGTYQVVIGNFPAHLLEEAFQKKITGWHGENTLSI